MRLVSAPSSITCDSFAVFYLNFKGPPLPRLAPGKWLRPFALLLRSLPDRWQIYFLLLTVIFGDDGKQFKSIYSYGTGAICTYLYRYIVAAPHPIHYLHPNFCATRPAGLTKLPHLIWNCVLTRHRSQQRTRDGREGDKLSLGWPKVFAPACSSSEFEIIL